MLKEVINIDGFTLHDLQWCHARSFAESADLPQSPFDHFGELRPSKFHAQLSRIVPFHGGQVVHLAEGVYQDKSRREFTTERHVRPRMLQSTAK